MQVLKFSYVKSTLFCLYLQSKSIIFLGLFAVYLNVTDLKTHQVGWDTLCVRWSPHRAATSYRLKLNPADGTCAEQERTGAPSSNMSNFSKEDAILFTKLCIKCLYM